MPELPEVETTRRGLDSVITGHQLNEIRIHHHQFRWPIPENLNQILQGHVLQACERRGKYLLLAFEHGVLMIHLGMSGAIRRVAPGEFLLKHDHVEFVFDNAESSAFWRGFMASGRKRRCPEPPTVGQAGH